jgi:predicted DNA-binding transcriptional regulator AlpA
MSPAKKQKRRKPTAAERARAAFDPDPTAQIDAAAPPPSERVVVEQARPPPPRLLSKAEVLALVPVSYPCLWAMMRRGEFPRGRKLAPGSNRVAWRESEVLKWIENLPPQKLKGDKEAARSK